MEKEYYTVWQYIENQKFIMETKTRTLLSKFMFQE